MVPDGAVQHLSGPKSNLTSWSHPTGSWAAGLQYLWPSPPCSLCPWPPVSPSFHLLIYSQVDSSSTEEGARGCQVRTL